MYQDSLTNQFARESWNPKTESLRAYVTRLESYRTQLASTVNQISDQQLITRILQSLPVDSAWQQAKLFALREDRDLSSTITLLQTYESALVLTSSEAVASIARDTHTKGKGRGRGRDRERKER